MQSGDNGNMSILSLRLFHGTGPIRPTVELVCAAVDARPYWLLKPRRTAFLLLYNSYFGAIIACSAVTRTNRVR